MSKRVVSAVVALALCGVVGMGATPSEPMIRCVTGQGNQFDLVDLPEGVWMARISIGKFRGQLWDSYLRSFEAGFEFTETYPASKVGTRVDLISLTDTRQPISLLNSQPPASSTHPIRFAGVVWDSGRNKGTSLKGNNYEDNYLGYESETLRCFVLDGVLGCTY